MPNKFLFPFLYLFVYAFSCNQANNSFQNSKNNNLNTSTMDKSIVINPHVRNVINKDTTLWFANWSEHIYSLTNAELKKHQLKYQDNLLGIRYLANRDSESFWILSSDMENSEVFSWDILTDKINPISLEKTPTMIGSGLGEDNFFYKASDLSLNFWTKENGSQELHNDCSTFSVSEDGQMIAIRRSEDNTILITNTQELNWKPVFAPLNGELMGFGPSGNLWILEISPLGNMNGELQSKISILDSLGNQEIYSEGNYYAAWLVGNQLVSTGTDHVVEIVSIK